MKQIITVVLLGLMLFSLSGCQSSSAKNNSNEKSQNNNATPPANSPAASTNKDAVAKKVLVAYFSYSGNTRKVAQQINESVQGDLFEVRTVNAYPKDYDDCVAKAKEEQRSNARPEITDLVANIEQYDTIFIGYPNWWGTMPMAMFTFLEKHNFSGKTIIPFCTHEGSRMGRSESDLAKLLPDAKIQKGLAIRGGSVNSASGDINNWLKNLDVNFAKK